MKDVISWYNSQPLTSSLHQFLDLHFLVNDPSKLQMSDYPINVLRNIGL